MANSIEVPVVLALNQAQEQIAQLRKALQEGVEPKSNEFKTIIRMIEQATNRAEHLKATMQSSFSTSSGAKKFSNEMQRTFDLINTIVGRMKNIDTKNLLFSEEDQEKINNIRTEIENTYKALTELKSGKIGTFFEGDIKEEFKDLGNLAKDLFSNLQKMSFTQLGEGLEKESKKVQESLDRIQEKIKSITSAQGKVSGNTNSDPFSILKTTTLTTVTPKVNRLIIDNLKNSLKQTFQEYNELFDIKSLTANLNKVTQKDVQQGSALTLQTDAITTAVEEAINKLKTEKNKYQQALEELSNVQTSGFGRDANGNKVSSRAAQAARENAANQARDIVQKLGIEAPEREDFEFVSAYVERLRTKVEEESTKFINEAQANLEQKGEQLKNAVSKVFKTSLSEFEINDSKGFQARVKEWLLGDLKLPEIGQELNNAISQMTKGTNVQEAFSILGNALKNSLNNSLEQLGNEETEAKAKAEALTKAMTDLGLIAQDNKGKIDLNEKSLADMQKRLEELLGQKIADFTKTIPIVDPKQTYEAENALTQYTNRLKELETRQKSLSNVQMAVKQWMGFYQVLNLGKKAITDMKNHIQELDSVMTQIAVVTNMSQSDLWGQISQYSQIARQYGVAIKGVYEVSQIYYQQGLEQNDVMTLTTETLKMARIAGLDYATAADYMTTAIRGFKLEMSDASHVTDVYSALAATTASSTEELAVAISKTASSAEAVGASFEATSAMMATMIATTRESATNIGTALKSVISRYGEMTKDPSKLVDSEGEEMSLNRVDAALQTIGISIHDVNGQFRDFDDVILELGKKWNTIDKNAQRYIATLMAGNRQQSRFLALVSNIDEYEKALATAQNAEGTGEVQTLKTLDSIDARLEKMKVTIQEFYTSSGLEELYKNVLDIITNIFDAANHLPKLFNKIPVTALAVGGTIINVIKNVLSLIVAEISTAMDTAKSNIDLTITKRIAKAKEDGRQIGKARKEGEIQGEQEVATGTSVKTGVGKQLLSIGARMGGAVLSAAGAGLTISGLNQYGSSLTKEQDRAAGGVTLGGALLGIGGSALTGFATGGPFGAVIGGITGLVSNLGSLTSAFSMLNVSTSRQIELAEKRLEKAKQEEAISKNEVKNLENSYNKLIELQKHQYDSVEDAKAYAEYMNQLGDSYPKFIESLSTSGDVIISVTAMEEELGRVRATALENTIKTIKNEKEAVELRQEVNKKFLEQIEDFSFSKNSEQSLKDFMYKLDPRGMYNEDTLFNWIEQYFNDKDGITENSSIKKFIERYSEGQLTGNLTESQINQFYKDAWNVLQIEGNTSLEDFKGYLSNSEIPILSNIGSQIIEAINSYISIPENKDFLKQFEGLEEAQDPISVIKNWSIEELLNLSNQIYTYINSVVNSTDEALGKLGTQINSAKASAEIQKRINNLLENKDTEDSGKKLQSYFKFITSLLNTKEAVENQFDNLSQLILSNTTTVDKLINLDLSQFSNDGTLMNSLPEVFRDYWEIYIEEFYKLRDTAIEGLAQQINSLKTSGLEFSEDFIFMPENEGEEFTIGLITSLIPAFRGSLEQYQALMNKGLFADARIYGDSIKQYFEALGMMEDEAQQQLSSITKNIDFTDYDSIISAAEQIKKLNPKDENYSQLAEDLIAAANRYSFNISLLLEQLKEGVTDTTKALETAFNDQTKAVSRSEAMKSAEELLKNYTGDEKLNWEDLYDYNEALGGWIKNNKALQIVIDNVTNNAQKKIDRANEQITKYNDLFNLSFYGEKEFGNILEQYLEGNDARKKSILAGFSISAKNEGYTEEKQKEVIDTFLQLAQEYSQAADQTWEDFYNQKIEQAQTDAEKAEQEIAQLPKQLAIDFLRGQNYTQILNGNYTNNTQDSIKNAIEVAIGKELDEDTWTNLWFYLINGQFELFNNELKNFGIEDNIISSNQVDNAPKDILKNHQTALNEIISGIAYEQMSQTTKDIFVDGIDDYSNAAWLEVQKIQNSDTATDKQKQEAMAQYLDYAQKLQQNQNEFISLVNRIKDKQISNEEAILSGLIDDNTGNLKAGLEKYLEVDLEKGGFKLKEGVSLAEAAKGLAEILDITIEEASKFYTDFLSESLDEQIKELDANDVSKQMLSQLQTLSSAKTGDRVRIDKLPAGIQEKLSSVIDDTYKVTSEFQLQAILAGLNASDFGNDAEAQRWLQQYKQEIENKKPIQQQALQNVIASNFSMDQAKTFIQSLIPNIDFSTYNKETIISLMKHKYGFDWDPFTQQFTATIEAINTINNLIQQYAEQGVNPENINNLKAMVNQLESQLGEGRKYNALSNIVDNFTKVTPEMIAELKNAYKNISGEKIEKAFQSNSDGTFKANLTSLFSILNVGFTDLINKTSDAYIENVQSILSIASNGTTSMEEMQKISKTLGADRSKIFSYDEILDAWKLDASQLRPLLEEQAKLLQENGFLSSDEINSWVQKQINSITVDQIDVQSILSAETEKDKEKYINILTDYYKTQSKENVAELAEKTFKTIRQGGQAAVDAIKNLNIEGITSEDLQAVYNYYSDSIISVMELLEEDIVGQFVSDEQAILLQQAGIKVNNNIVESVDNLVNAYENLYKSMVVNNESSITKLNAAYAKVLNAKEQGEADAIGALSDAMGMTYDTLGNLLGKYGYKLEEIANKENGWAEFGLKQIGGKKVRIEDFQTFATTMGWDYNSEEYINAYDTYVDSLITIREKTRKSILDEAKAIAEASAGDTINLTQLSAKIKELNTKIQNKFINNLSRYGAEFSSEGILELQDDADIYHVLQTIYDIANEGNLLLEDDLVELRDVLDQVLKSFSDTLSKGIEGNLSQVELSDLLEKSSNLLHINLSDADFTRTAEGFKISTDAAIKLYTQLEKIDRIQARLVFNKLSESLQSSNDHYKSTINLLTHIKDLHEKIAKFNGKKDSTKLQQYKEELAVAEKIAQVRATTEDSSFSFMDNKLEGGLNNPVNYLNSWGQANKMWNEAIKDAQERQKAFQEGTSSISDFNVYFDPAAFQNIVNALNDAAGQAGTEIEFLGYKLDGNLETAAALIQKGFSTITNVDGEGAKVNLSALGVNLLDGGKMLNKNATAAIHSIAEAQIKILDGLINVMETVVALEGFTEDVNKNGEFDINDLFSDKNNWELNDTTKQKIQNIVNNDSLMQELSKYEFKGEKLSKFFKVIAGKQGKQLQDALKSYGIQTQQEFFEFMKQFEGINDWDKSAESIFQALDIWTSKTENLTYENKNIKRIEIGNTKYKIDYSEESTQTALKQIKGSEEEQKKKFERALIDYNIGGLDIIKQTDELTAVLTFKGLVTDIKTDEKNNIVRLTYKGKEYEGSTKQQALQKALLAEAGEGVNNFHIDESESGELTGQIDVGQATIKLATTGKNGAIQYSIETDKGTITKDSLKDLEDAWIRYNLDKEENQNKDSKQLENELRSDWEAHITGNVLATGEFKNNIYEAVRDGVKEGILAAEKEIQNETKKLVTSLEQINSAEIDTTPFETIESFLRKAYESASNLIGLAWNSLTSILPSLNSYTPFTKQSSKETPKINEPQQTSLKVDANTEPAENKLKATKKLINGTVSKMGIKAEDRGASNTAKGIKNAIDQMWAYIKVTVSDKTNNFINNITNALLELTRQTYKVTVEANVISSGSSVIAATGNVGIAQAKGTLMGELGPELVVQNGRYFVVGQSGPEFVDLGEDAIVFNHLQTEQLLKHGMSSTRGRAVTNERNAVSYATGNVNGGVAMASASAVLEELRKIRSMWESILKASLSDLGQLAGMGSKSKNKGSGSGKGSNDKPYNNSIDPGFIADLERWYNLLRQIEKLERDINYQEKLRTKIQSDRTVNGKALYDSYKRDLKSLDEEIIARQQLAHLKKEYYDQRRKELEEDTNYGRIFTFNEEGLMQYNDQGIMPNGDKGGLTALAMLNATNPNNSSVYSIKDQYDILQSWGFGEDMLYDSSGKKITFGEDETDEQARVEAQEAGWTEAVKAFWDKADGWKEELDGLYDDYHSEQEAILEADTKRNEILKQIVDNQLAVEDKIYDAIVESREAEIEEIQNERDALEETTSKFIDGLSKQLNRERQMYQNQQSESELNKLRRQLGILQRSGGSSSAIRSLQTQISEKERSIYFDEQQQQIDAIQEASDLQIEKLDNQIDLMNEQLEYQKAQGLLWAQVYEVMRGTPASINQFITQNTKEWATYSSTKWDEEYRLLNGQTTQWGAYMSDTEAYRTTWDGVPIMVRQAVAGQDEHGWHTYDEAMYKLLGEDWQPMRDAAYNYYTAHYDDTADPNYIANQVVQALNIHTNSSSESIALNPSGYTTPTFSSSDNLITEVSDYGGYQSSSNASTNTASNTATPTGYLKVICRFNDGRSDYIKTFGPYPAGKKYQDKAIAYKLIGSISGYGYNSSSSEWTTIVGNSTVTVYLYYNKAVNTTLGDKNSKDRTVSSYSTGGLVDYTGLAMVHGSKTRPEAVLNADETKMWREKIFSGSSNSLTNQLLNFQKLVDGLSLNLNGIQNNNTNERNVAIEHVEINMNANIANDYDAHRAGENIVEEIMKIARKSSVSSIRR